MKDKVLVFIIGVLLGAVITAAGFFIYEKVNKNDNQITRSERMEMRERPDGQMPQEMPSNSENPPTKPEMQSNN